MKVWTVADLADLPDDGNRYEVIDGELHVTPAPSLDHQEAAVRLYTLLAPFVDAHGFGTVVVAPADVSFSPTSGVQPDLFVMPRLDGRRARRFLDVGRLLLAVEILSPSTARWNRVKKRALYRKHVVPEYWVVDLDARVIERSTPARRSTCRSIFVASWTRKNDSSVTELRRRRASCAGAAVFTQRRAPSSMTGFRRPASPRYEERG